MHESSAEGKKTSTTRSVAHTVRLFLVFLTANIRGSTPPIRHRWYENVVVYAKPDLRRTGSRLDLIGFKAAPIDECARTQPQ
ncbi:hypothetical protein [Halocatena salina]|uniref:Uncharacterized protein n=1 Tax=Halocatena salina TaxID=2934340 RepID=A0A8T9ZZI8_9EURY|nr:hypothetical protein [Halocatena salina]UPM41859.1 hypothetical protein MW046_07655 [Halocatena salina]